MVTAMPPPRGYLPTHCTCGEKLLNPHALQPICAECRLIERNARLTVIEAELRAQRRYQAAARAIAQLDKQIKTSGLGRMRNAT
ncbi:hypothetical protein ACKUVQ_00305 [Mycobacterium seoulense]|uniref:hypothetical protein n=1 Tax=Mycobacterium seoulense TaxID=386911 RepID=UPI003CEB2D7C